MQVIRTELGNLAQTGQVQYAYGVLLSVEQSILPEALHHAIDVHARQSDGIRQVLLRERQIEAILLRATHDPQSLVQFT